MNPFLSYRRFIQKTIQTITGLSLSIYYRTWELNPIGLVGANEGANNTAGASANVFADDNLTQLIV